MLVIVMDTIEIVLASRPTESSEGAEDCLYIVFFFIWLRGIVKVILVWRED